MESRKKRNLEIERAKKQKRLIFTSILSCLVLLAVVALVYAVWDITDRRTIMTFNGERIATTDFRFFHTMQQIPAGEFAQQNALNELTQTLVILERGEQHGVGVTAQEMPELLEQARGMREEFAMTVPGGLNFISERRIAEFMSVSLVFERLVDIYMTDFEPDEQEYQETMEAVMDNIHLNSTDVLVQYVTSPDFFELDDILHEIYEGADFQDFSETAPVSLMEFAGTYDAWMSEELGAIFESYQPGEVSEVFNVDGQYFILQVYDRVLDEENVAAMTESVREDFIHNSRAQAFFERINEWIDQADREVNQRAISRF